MLSVLIYSESDLSRDPRVKRQIIALKENYDVIALGTASPRMSGVRYIEIASHGIAAGTNSRFLSLVRSRGYIYASVYTLCWIFEKTMILYSVKDFLERNVLRRESGAKIYATNADMIIANDLSALAICVANDRGRPVLYDAHEYSPGQFPRIRSTLGKRSYAKYLLNKYLCKTKGFITIGSAIGEKYRKEYFVEPVVITNAPEYKSLFPKKPIERSIRLVHHGIAARRRALEIMIQTLCLLDERFTLDFYLMPTDPGYLDYLKILATGNQRIRFLPPVPTDNIANTLNDYDLGIFILPPTTVNQKYVLPNKIFEFIQARLGVAVGPSPEMAALVREWDIGVVASSFSPESMAKALKDLNAAKIEKYKSNSDRCAREFTAEANAKIFRSTVENCLRGT